MMYKISNYSQWVRTTSLQACTEQVEVERPGEVSFLGGGQNNKVCAGTCYSSILGGQNNIVQHNWASASGYNITSVMDCAFHANNLVVPNMPVGITGNSKQLYYMATAGPGSPCAVYIV